MQVEVFEPGAGDATFFLTFWRSSSGARVHGSGIRKLESRTTVLVNPLLFGVTGRLYIFYSVPTRTNSIPSRRFLRLWDGSADKFKTGNVLQYVTHKKSRNFSS